MFLLFPIDCSHCVRKFISVKSSCPVCFAPLTDSALRPNRVLEEIISLFKPVMVHVLKSTGQNHPTTSHQAPEAVCPASCFEASFNKDKPARASCSRAPENHLAPSSEQVPCPVCRTYMKQSMINVHLDSCLYSGAGAAAGPMQAAPESTKRKPLPKFVYHIIKDSELKKKLKELGLSTTGDKNTLINRHCQVTAMYS